VFLDDFDVKNKKKLKKNIILMHFQLKITFKNLTAPQYETYS